MRETLILEEVIKQLIRLPKFWISLLVGSLLSFVPIVNIFAFGYLHQVFRGVSRLEMPALPPWNNWRELFLDGLRFTIVWICYWIVPILIAAGLSSILTHLGLGVFSGIVFFSIILLSNILFIAAISHYHIRENYKDLLSFRLILNNARIVFPNLIVPSFVFLGFFLWLLPFYGFGLFGGFLLLLTCASLHH
ncbi:MAG: DUF4013 domain-containing protein [Verrucomicrobiota bacterium]|nr:DUF4013 domain-containing protein [Verrucomicrobiota bacterium]